MNFCNFVKFKYISKGECQKIQYNSFQISTICFQISTKNFNIFMPILNFKNGFYGIFLILDFKFFWSTKTEDVNKVTKYLGKVPLVGPNFLQGHLVVFFDTKYIFNTLSVRS